MADTTTDKILNSIQETLTLYGIAVTDAIKEQILKQGKVATGNLLGSITFQIKKFDTIISLQIGAADYLQWVELGRSKGKFPPIAEILIWVKAKGIRPRGLPPKNTTSLFKQQKRSAFAIAKSIKEYGIKKKPVLQPALDQTTHAFNIEIGKAVVMSTKKLIGDEFAAAVNEIANKKIRIKTNF